MKIFGQNLKSEQNGKCGHSFCLTEDLWGVSIGKIKTFSHSQIAGEL